MATIPETPELAPQLNIEWTRTTPIVSVRQPERSRPLVHLLAAAAAGLLVGAIDGLLSANRAGLGELTGAGHQSAVLLAVALNCVAWALAGLCLGGALWLVTAKVDLLRLFDWALSPAARKWFLGAGGFFGASFGVLDLVKRPEWEAVDFRLPLLVLLGATLWLVAAILLRRLPRRAITSGLVVVLVTWLLVLLAYTAGRDHEGEGVVRIGTDSPLAGRLLVPARGFFDGDGDGFPSRLCAEECDCNDDDPAIHPTAEDVPDNGVDEDCMGGDLSGERVAAFAKVFERPARARAVSFEADSQPGARAWSQREVAPLDGALAESEPLELPVAALPPEPEPVPTLPTRPNILFITVDTIRLDRMGLYGYERPTSPNLDAWADGARVFTQARATGPQTRFSVPPMIIGKYFTELHRTEGEWPAILDNEHTLAERLDEAGYRTAAFHSIGYFKHYYGFNQGFDHYDDSCLRERAPTRYTRTSDYVTDRVLEYADEAQLTEGHEPFYLWVYYGDPHSPYLEHKEHHFGSGHGDRYDGEIAFTDAQIGRLLVGLEERGLLEDTIVVFTSDHGEGLDPEEDHGHRWHGPNLHDEVMRVPFVVKGPGVIPGRDATPISLIDLVPTVMELAGLDEDPTLRGVSLVPWLRGESPEHPPSFFEKHKETALPQKGMVMWPYKVILVLPYLKLKIFDLEKDPRERVNLAKTLPAEERQFLVGLLQHWYQEVLEPRPAKLRRAKAD